MNATQGSSGLKFFVGGVPNEVKRRELLAYFRQFGEVKRITNFNPNHGKKLFGFCFVKFDSLSSDALFDKSRQFSFLGRNLEIDPIIRRSCLKRRVEERHLKRVFLPNLPTHLTKEDLVRAFSCFGNLTNCFVVERKEKRCAAGELAPSGALSDLMAASKSNYGFVIFEEQRVAQMLVSRGSLRIDPCTEVEIVKYSPQSGKESGPSMCRVEGSNPAESARQTTCSKEELGQFSAGQAEENAKPTSKSYFAQARRCLAPVAWKQASNLRFNLQRHRASPATRNHRQLSQLPGSPALPGPN